MQKSCREAIKVIESEGLTFHGILRQNKHTILDCGVFGNLVIATSPSDERRWLKALRKTCRHKRQRHMENT